MTLKTVLQKIKDSKERSKPLEMDASVRSEITEQVIQYAERFLQSLPQQKTYESLKDNLSKDLNLSNQPEALENLVQLIEQHIDKAGVNTASSGYLGYVPAGGLYLSALSDYMVAITNRYSGLYFLAPLFVKLENALIRWMCKLVGYSKTAFGSLTTGGSLATLTCIVAAREAKQIKAKNFHKLIIYLTSQTHHCLQKALRIAGLNEVIIQTIPLDEKFRMDPEILERSIQQDLKKNRMPWMIVATAGTTNLGAIDSIKDISLISKKYKLWLHVDAAYGGFFLLLPKTKQLMTGIEQADSIILDPHKTLFVPYGLGVALVKNADHLRNAYHYTADYLQEAKHEDEFSPANYSLELTRHTRGLRLWLPLKFFGLDCFRAALEEKLLLTHYFYQQLKKFSHIEILDEPQLSIVVFRYLPEQADADSFNIKLIEAIKNDGRIFMSGTSINKKFYLRMACLSFRTHLETMDTALTVIQEKIAEIQN